MKGTPWEPVPGKRSDEIQTRIQDRNQSTRVPERNEAESKEVVRRGFWKTRKNVIKYGRRRDAQDAVLQFEEDPEFILQRSAETDSRCCLRTMETDELKEEQKEC